MSSYIVQDQTINSILAFLRYNSLYKHNGSQHISRGLADSGLNYNLANSESLQVLGETMAELNIQAVEICYPGRSEKMLDGPAYEFSQKLPTPDRMQALKSLSCFLYQCNEGGIRKTSTLYQALREVKFRLAMDLIQDLPQWEDAQWG